MEACLDLSSLLPTFLTGLDSPFRVGEVRDEEPVDSVFVGEDVDLSGRFRTSTDDSLLLLFMKKGGGY